MNVGVTVEVTVGVTLAVGVTDDVTVGVKLAVGVNVGVTVGVTELVTLGVTEGVKVGVVVGVGVNSAEQTTLTSSMKLPILVEVVELNIKFKFESFGVNVTNLKSHCDVLPVNSGPTN